MLAVQIFVSAAGNPNPAMNKTAFLFDGPKNAETTICLAHGAGALMDSDFMQAFAEGLGAEGFRVARFEFPYMAERRATGKRKPPNRAPMLMEYWLDVVAQLSADNLIIGGKSMGGRMASLVADEAGVKGLICLGYPFHAPGKEPGTLRLDHLETLKTPTLICQGTRDALGGTDDVAGYRLSAAVRLHWLEDGDHGFKPRKKSGHTENGNWTEAMTAITEFANGL